MLIAGGLTGALVVIVVAWSSVGHHGGGPVPVIQADQRPVRVKPANPGGMQIPGLSADTGAGDDTASADKLAPAPETPDPQGLAKQTRMAALTPPVVPPLPASGGPVRPVTGGAPTAAASAASAPPNSAPPPVAKQAAVVPAAVMPDRQAAAPATHGPVGRTQVQLAAVATEAAARQEWDRLAHRMPNVLATHHPMFSKIERDGHALWRVRTGDFTTEAEATQFCQHVRANGGGCAVAAF